MMSRLVWTETDNTYPYRNPAVEEYMTFHVPQGICILHLWQNHHTVAVGKNQDCWRECRMNFLEQEDGYLVRRLSGGGAVFHDPRNLNFTFIVGAEDYDVSRQLDVILEAVRSLGIHTEETGCNDITVEGRKFSGNTFYRTGDSCYYHGAILIRVGKENISQHSNVSKEKLASKGVTSVRSRVANLCEFKPDITLEEVKVALVGISSRVYGQPAVRMKEKELPQPEIDVLIERFASRQWRYGRKILSEYETEKRFPWGSIQIQLHVDRGVIQDVDVFSNAMGQEMLGALAKQLRGCDHAEEDICAAAETVGLDAFQTEEHTSTDVPQPCQIKEDIKASVRESL